MDLDGSRKENIEAQEQKENRAAGRRKVGAVVGDESVAVWGWF